MVVGGRIISPQVLLVGLLLHVLVVGLLFSLSLSLSSFSFFPFYLFHVLVVGLLLHVLVVGLLFSLSLYLFFFSFICSMCWW